jgi:hypothetical protein
MPVTVCSKANPPSRAGGLPDGAFHRRDLGFQAAQHGQGPGDKEDRLRCEPERGDGLRAELANPVQRDALAGEPRQPAVQTEDDGGLLPDPLPALAEQIPQRPVGLRIDVPGRQQPEPQKVRQPAGVVLIVRVFQPAVLRQRGDMREVHDVARVHQAVDEPIPIISLLTN